MTQDQATLALIVLKYLGLIVTFLIGLFGILRRTHQGEGRRRKLTTWGKWAVRLLIVGFLVSIATLAIQDCKQQIEGRESKKREQELLTEIRELKKKDQELLTTVTENFSQISKRLGIAEQERSPQIKEEQIRLIQKDLSDWADEFVKNQPSIKNNFDKIKADFEQGQQKEQTDFVKKQLEYTRLARPPFEFAIRLIQESVRAYGKKSGKNITIEPLELTENLCKNPVSAKIFIDTNATWNFIVDAPTPGGTVLHEPMLDISFTAGPGGDDILRFQLEADQKKFSISYFSKINSPLSATVAGDYDLSDYETSIRKALQPIIEEQLVRASESVPIPGA